MATLGYTTVGSSLIALAANGLKATKVVLAAELDGITDGYIYVDGSGGGTGTQPLQMAVYADSAGSPSGAAIATSSVHTITNGDAAGWAHVTFTSFNLLAGTYWLMLNVGTTTNVGRFYRDNVAGYTYGFATVTYGTWPSSPSLSTSASEAVSMYLQGGVSAPTNTVAPTVSGSTTDGSTLTSSTGTWTGSPTSYSYQWTRAGSNISGATSSTYVLQLIDRGQAIGCKVVATNSGGSSSPVASSNTITGAAPTFPALGKVRYAPPPQHSPITVDLSATPGNYYVSSGSGNLWTPGADYIVNLGSIIHTGVIDIDANGARSVKIIGGQFYGPSGQNYALHITNIAGWAFVEGLEFDMAGTQADALDLSGGTLYTPDIYMQNVRIINLNGTDSTNHADWFQPQGMVGNVYIDKFTGSSNYQGFTIAASDTENVPALGFNFHRVNCWFSAANGANPVTYLFWLNDANGTANRDTAPFPLWLDRVYIDLARGYGRSSYTGIGDAIWPNTDNGPGTAGGGNYEGTSTASVFTNGEVIGCDVNGVFSNSKMMVTGKPTSGSPPSGSDTGTDTDSALSYVPAGVGAGYSSPGYETPLIAASLFAT